jgi:cyclase
MGLSMLKKRLIGVVTVKNGWAVQSFGYGRHLPLGRPDVLVQNLDRWGADEILVQCIDRSLTGLGPDLDVLSRISKIGITTPLIYAGGISCREDAIKVISIGADRIMIDAMLLDAPQSLEGVARELGTQAIVANLPARVANDGLMTLNYRNRKERPLAESMDQLCLEWISELMVSNWENEGMQASFDEQLLDISQRIDKPLLLFGGISEAVQIERLLSHPQVMAVGVGNFLSYREHSIQTLKQQLSRSAVRSPYFKSSEFSE